MDRSRQCDGKPGSQTHSWAASSQLRDSTQAEGTSPAPLWLAGLHLTPPAGLLPSCQMPLAVSPECCRLPVLCSAAGHCYLERAQVLLSCAT